MSECPVLPVRRDATSLTSNGAVVAEIRRSVDGEVSDVWFSGELDLAAAEPLLTVLADEPRRTTCRAHTAAVEFIDCAGLDVLVSLQRQVREQGATFALADRGPTIERLLALIDPADTMFSRPAEPIW